MNLARWVVTVFLCALGSACHKATAPADLLASIEVTPAVTSQPVGASTAFRATGHYESGARDLTETAVWTTDNRTVVRVQQAGAITALSQGVAQVVASIDAVSGSAQVTVTAPAPQSLVVAPNQASVPGGMKQSFQVVGTLWSDGSLQGPPSSVAWSSSDSSIASVGLGGLATALSVGSANIVAIAQGSSGSVSGSATLQVTEPVLTEIDIAPKTLGAAAGLSRQLRALGIYSDQSRKDVTNACAWTSTQPAIASVSARGVSHALTKGTATLSCSIGQVVGQMQLTVYDQRVVFITSGVGQGNLGSWPTAAGKAGLEAGDAICNSEAASAGLPGEFKAWLSDSNDDAYCRIHRRLGKKVDSCGAATLPSDAGPWIRPDGEPIAASLDELLSDYITFPITLDATGAEVRDQGEAWTDTTDDGIYVTDSASSCLDWTGTDGPNGPLRALVGWPKVVGQSWSVAGYLEECEYPGVHLVCFEVGVGSGPPVPDWHAGAKVAFLTSASGSGDLSSWPAAGAKRGLEAGDEICAASAAAAGLTGQFVAWLSSDSVNAIDRLAFQGPWMLTDSTLLAATSTEVLNVSGFFTEIDLREPLDLDEAGQFHKDTVWTGTAPSGVTTRLTCKGWSDAANAQGLFGGSVFLSGAWTGAGQQDCSQSARLYCLGQ